MGRSAAAGHPKNETSGPARMEPTNPNEDLKSAPRMAAIPSATRAPPRNRAKRRRAMPQTSRLRAARLGSTLSGPVWSESSDLPFLEDRDNRERIHGRGDGEVGFESRCCERLPVGRVLEDFLDVVAISPVDQCRRGG